MADAAGASKDAVLSSGLVPLRNPAANGELAVESAIDPAQVIIVLQPHAVTDVILGVVAAVGSVSEN